MPCGAVVEIGRRCYASRWRLYRDRPEIETAGYYYRAAYDAPFIDDFTIYTSRNWQDGDWQNEPDLGEVRAISQPWRNGVGPSPEQISPRPPFDCLSGGEPNIPPPTIIRLSVETFGVVVVTGELPDITIGFPPPTPPNECCAGVLVDDDTSVLLDADTGVLLDCDCVICIGVLVVADTGVLLDADTGVLLDCPEFACVAVLIDDDTGVLLDADTGVLLDCHGCVGILIDLFTGVLVDSQTGTLLSCAI